MVTLPRLAFALTTTFLLGACTCGRDELPPPLPTTPVASATPATALEIEDAGEDAADSGDAAPPKPRQAGLPQASLRACCSALRQNAANAPEPTKTYLEQAAGACDAAVAQGKDKASVTAVVTGMLRGAGMPAACR